MLRNVMEGNAALIEPPAVFAREMQAAGFTPAGNWDATDEVIPSSMLIKRYGAGLSRRSPAGSSSCRRATSPTAAPLPASFTSSRSAC